MKACITKIKDKYFYTFLSLFIILTIWEFSSRNLSPLVLPSVLDVFKKIIDIFSNKDSISMIFITVHRLFIGYGIGLAIGLIFGVLMGQSNVLDKMISPLIGIIQTIPPVSWLVLALVWFGIGGKPAIFIISLSTIPIVGISVKEAFDSIDYNLIEMSKVYNFSNKKTFFEIILPTIMPFFRSGSISALGNSWKIAAMSEVLTTTDGIGGMIKLARINIEPDSILAWSIILVILYFISKVLFVKLFSLGGVYSDRN
ncbi:MAG: ABC transporter permease subunit [Peptostreptococcus sp.]|uniref:ABC transporter permease n=1 Tax=Peptostreptococcus sp. TaxID=1262 RepID=UPI002FCC5C61